MLSEFKVLYKNTSFIFLLSSTPNLSTAHPLPHPTIYPSSLSQCQSFPPGRYRWGGGGGDYGKTFYFMLKRNYSLFIVLFVLHVEKISQTSYFLLLQIATGGKFLDIVNYL